MFFFNYFNLISGFKLVTLISFFFVNGEIKLTYLLILADSKNYQDKGKYAEEMQTTY